MAYSIQLPDGTLVQNIPDEVDPSEAKRRIISQHPELAPKAGMLESAGAGLAGGVANMGLGAAAAAADYTGFKDTAADLDAKRKAVEAWQQQHGGDTTTGKIANLVGGLAPALAMPEAGIPALLANGTLFAIPGFRDSYQQQIDAGASPTVAAMHGLANAGFAMVGGKLVSAGSKALPKALQAGEGLGSQLAHAAGEGAAFDTASQITNKGIDVASGRQTDTPWLDPKQVAENAAAFGVLRGAHVAMDAPARARAQAEADKAKADADAVKAQQKADFEAQQAAAKQTPEYLRKLDTDYQTMLQQQQAARAALGTKPTDKSDPSAIMAWENQKKALDEKLASLDNANLVAEHADRRPEIDTLRAQDQAKAAADAQVSQSALETGADQPTASAPVDTTVAPLDKNAQPDLFAEGQTSPSGTPVAAPADVSPIEQRLQTASQALVDHENAMNTLRDQAKAAVASGDMDAVMRHSTQANELSKQLKPLQDAVEQLRNQHKPSVDADVAKLKQKLQDAAEAGDTAKMAKLAAQIKEKQAGVTGQQNVTAAPAQNQARDAGIADEMATGRGQTAATTAKVGAETDALQRMGEKAKESSEAQGILNRDALTAQQQRRIRGKLKLPTPTLREEAQAGPRAQEALPEEGEPGTAETWGELTDQKLKQRVDAIGENIVNPEASAMEQQVRELKREQAQHTATLNDLHAIRTRIKTADPKADLSEEQLTQQQQSTQRLRSLQLHINELESRLRVNPHTADTVAKVDDLHRQLEKANNNRESAHASNDAPAVEAASLQAKKIADQLAQVQKEPGSVAGRLVKAKNDVSHFLTAFFDAAHEVHTSGMVRALREKQAELQKVLASIDRRGGTDTIRGEEELHTSRVDIVRQLKAIDAQLGAMNTETAPAKLSGMARKAMQQYIRAAFREENIRREARRQQPLTSAERTAFAKQATERAEALLTRVEAERGSDFLEEYVVQPAQMRSGQVVKSAVTEWRDSRALEDRPLAKFGPARAVEEEAFHNERGVIRGETQRADSPDPADAVRRSAIPRQIAGMQARIKELVRQLRALDRPAPTADEHAPKWGEAVADAQQSKLQTTITGLEDRIKALQAELAKPAATIPSAPLTSSGKRVEGTGIKRQWDGVQRPEDAAGTMPVKSSADQRANNERLLEDVNGPAGAMARDALESADVNNPQGRRARYLTNMLHAADRANPDMNAALKPLFDALEESPTTGVMDVVEPLIREALTGRLPTGGERVRGTSWQKALFGGERVSLPNADLNRVKEALALAREVRSGDENAAKQRNLFDPQVAQQEQGRIEDKQAANEERADEINKKTYVLSELRDAERDQAERGKLSEDNEKLEKEREKSKVDEHALKGEADRMATSHSKETPTAFADSPEVKEGRAAVDAARAQIEEFTPEKAKPSWFSALVEKLRDVKDSIEAFVQSRPFYGQPLVSHLPNPERTQLFSDKPMTVFSRQEVTRDMAAVREAEQVIEEKRATLAAVEATKTPDTPAARGARTRRVNAARKALDEALAHRNTLESAVKDVPSQERTRYIDPKTGKPASIQREGEMYTPEDAIAIRAQIAEYNKFAMEMNAFLVEQQGEETPAFVAMRDQLDLIKRALQNLPTDPETVKLRRAAKTAQAKLDAAKTEPAAISTNGKVQRAKRIERLQEEADAAEGARHAHETGESPEVPAARRRIDAADQRIRDFNKELKARVDEGKSPTEEDTIQGRILSRAKTDAEDALDRLLHPDVKTPESEQRVATAAEIAKRNAEMDAAVEERMHLDEAMQRLAKLPATVVTRDSGITDAIRIGLSREAAGIRAKLDLVNLMRADPDFEAKSEKAIKDAIAAKKPAVSIAKMKNRLADARSLDKSDEGLRKWEKLLENSERNLQQLEDVAPRRVTQRGEPTSEKDDITPIEPLNKDVANAGKWDESKAPLKFTTNADDNVSKRVRAKDTTEAEAAAEALNDKQVAGGRGVVTRKIGVGQGKVSVQRKKASVTSKTAQEDGVYASAEKRAREIDAALDHIAELRKINDEKMRAAIENEDAAAIEKHTAFNERFDKATAKLNAEYAPLDKLLNKGVKRAGKVAEAGSHAVDVAEGDAPDIAELQAHDVDTSARIEDPNAAPNKPSAERTSTPLSEDAIAAVKENRLPDALHDIARTSADPEAREAATRLAPFVDRTDVGVERFTVRGEKAVAVYIPEENRVAVHPEGLTEQELLHESAHAATDGVMLADPAKLNPEQRKARAGLEGMWNSTKNNPTLQGEHATTSAREFVAEVYTNPEFRAKLDSIGKPLSLLERFKNFVRQMFGYPTSPSGKARDMVDKILTRSDKIKGEAAPSIFRPKKEYTSETAKFGRDLSQNRSVVQDVKAAGWKKLLMAAEQKIVDSRAALRYTAKIGDNHTGTQVMGDILTADRAMQNAMAVFTKGGFKLAKDSKGLTVMKADGKTNAKEVVQRIGELPGKGTAEEKMDLFQGYMTALRARDVGWHTLDYDNPAEMQRRGEAAIKEVQSDPALLAAMNKAQDTYHEYNKELVQFLKDTNAVPDAVADKMMQDRNYIPMFRNKGDSLEMVMQNGKSMSVGDVRTLPFLHALNGGNAKLMPFEESMFRNTTMLTNLGVQNMTARHIAYHLQGIGSTVPGKTKPMQIREGDGGAARGGTTIRFRDKPQNAQDDGERHIVIDTKGTAAEHIPNDLLAQAVAGSYSSTPALLNMGKYASDILRSGVTRVPTYLVSQMWKDPVNAAIMGNLKADPFTSVVKSMNNMREHLTGKSSEALDMEAMGILHSNVFNGTPDDVKKMLMHLGGSNQGWYRNAMSKLDNIAMGADSATRIQGYRDVIKAGGSELEAAIHAQEMQNFSKHGSSQSMQVLSRLIPFFNAQVQGLNVLLKSATGKMPANELLDTKNKFFKRALGMTALSLAYAASLDDDPEWRKLSLRSQMSNIKIGEGQLPAPFETGMLFYSLPVAFIHALKQNFNENDWADVRAVISNQLPGNGSIMPQFAKGYVDVSRNYNSYFGSPIESRRMDKLATTEKYAGNTPEMMKEFSRHLVDMGVNLSPVQLDYLSNAYLGQLPHMVGMVTNHLFETKSAAHDGGEAATGTAKDNPLLARFVPNPKESRNVNDAYTRVDHAMLTDATIKAMKTDGRAPQAEAYRKEQLAQYGTPQQARAFQNQMGFMKRQEEAIKLDKSLDGPGKQKKIEELYKRRDAAAANYLKIVDAKQAA